MGINPFKDSNLENLQEKIRGSLSDHFGFIINILKDRLNLLLKKGKERITIMFIPHSEKKITNFHIPLYIICLIGGILIITITITSLIIINHTSTIKDVSKLKRYDVNSNIQIKKYKEEINSLYSIFQKLKPELTYLYSLTHEDDVDSLWAKGGASSLNTIAEVEESDSPPIEVLNIKEIGQELKTTKNVIEKIKSFLEARKKIIENTPSLWPVDGYIISKYGLRTSPYISQNGFQKGIEIAAFPGAKIRSAAPGTVKSIKWDPVHGLSISIKHKYGFSTKYSHCQGVSVEVDQNVSKGELIGYVGKTGKTTRHICYYQIKIGTEYVNALPYLNKLSR